MFNKGDCFLNDENLPILIRGRDDQYNFIVFCMMQTRYGDNTFQINFFPIHEDLLKIGQEFPPGDVYEENLKMEIAEWTRNNDRTYWSISPLEIVKLIFDTNIHKKFLDDKGNVCIPMFFPDTAEGINNRMFYGERN